MDTSAGPQDAGGPAPGTPLEHDFPAVFARSVDHLVDTIDRERQLIAGQLHDDSIQAMTAVALNLQRLLRTSDVDREQIERLLRLTNDAIDRLRHMMFALHPPNLSTDGLVATLEEYLDGFLAPTGLAVSVRGERARRSSPATEALAFRLARGALQNTWKHAQATSVEVSVDIDDDGVEIVVRDDGVGFDVASRLHPDVGHAGIEYAGDLAAEVGGRYQVESAPGAGTTVTVFVPVLAPGNAGVSRPG